MLPYGVNRSQWIHWQKTMIESPTISDNEVNTMPPVNQALSGTRPSAGTMMTRLRSHISTMITKFFIGSERARQTWIFFMLSPVNNELHGKIDTEIYSIIFQINSLRPSDAIGQQRSGSTLAQVMACCLMAPSHYLNQCSLLISDILWHSPQINFIVRIQATVHV